MKNFCYKKKSKSVPYRYLFWDVSSLQPKLKQLITNTLMVLALCFIVISGTAQCNTWPAPQLTNTTITNNCPNTLVELGFITPDNFSSAPGASWSWHTGPIASAANQIPPGPNMGVPSGTYYMAFWDQNNNCYSSGTLTVTASALSCVPCYYLAAPVVASSSITNNYPFTRVYPHEILDVIPWRYVPVSQYPTLHTGTPATNLNKVPYVTTSGLYYSANYNSYSDCYSLLGAGTTPINITIKSWDPPINQTQCSSMTSLPFTNAAFSNKIYSTSLGFTGSGCTPVVTSPNIQVGYTNPNPAPFTGVDGEFTLTFPHPTGLIDLFLQGITNLGNGASYSQEYVEIWLNDTLIDLSTFPGATLLQGSCGTDTAIEESDAISSATNLGYPNKPGVVYHPKWGGQQGNQDSRLLIDLESYGLAASKIRVRVIHAYGDGGGVVIRPYWCSDTATYPSRLSYPCMTTGVSVPAISASTATVNCSTNTADLSVLTVSNAPSNTIVTYHTALPATSSNQITTTAAPLGGPYHAVFYDTINTCYGTVDTLVTVTSNCPCTAAGTVAPILSSTTNSNTCPSTTSNLTNLTASNLPIGTSLTWHTATPATNANKIAGTSVAAGTYYAAFYSAINDCYSGTNGSATTALTVTINACGTQCSNGSAPLDGNGPLVTNKFNAQYNPTFFCGANTGGSLIVGPTDGLNNLPQNGEFTVTFPNPTGLIELDIRAIDNVDGSGKEYIEIWLNDTLIDLSTFPGVTLTEGNVGCSPPTIYDTIAISSASNLGYPGQAGVIYAPSHPLSPSATSGNGKLTIDLGANGLAASKLRYRNIHATGDGLGTRVKASWCNDSALYPVGLTYPCTAVGSAAPALSSNAAAVNCTSYIADLSTITASNTPANTTVTYHTALPATTVNKITASSAAQGSYYAVFYDATNTCYGFANTQVTVTSNCPCATAGSSAPVLSASTATNTCPVNTVDLTAITASNLPASTTLTWHTATPATTGNKIAGTSVSTSGTYYGAFFDATNNCYSGTGGSATAVVTVTVVNCCNAGSTVPALTTTSPAYFASSNTLYNQCPAASADLNVFTATNQPANTTLTWHSATPATTANKVSGTVTSAPWPGVDFYASIFDSTNNCYSPTSVVKVQVNGCCNAGFSSPLLSSTSSTNVCPATTADLSTITASNVQLGAYISWHTSTPATNANKISGASVAAGTYYAAFHDSVNNCYSGFTGDSTTAVTVTINSCGPVCSAGNIAPALSATTATNACPSNTTDLTAITASNLPSNATLTWHTATPVTTANKVTGTTVTSGTYYGAFYDSNLDCYSGTSGSATSAVTVTQTPCCNAGTVAPSVN